MAKPTQQVNKQTVAVNADGVNLTWNHERSGPMSSRDVAELMINAARASDRFRRRDPRKQAIAPVLLGAAGLALLGTLVLGGGAGSETRASQPAAAEPWEEIKPAPDPALLHAERQLYTDVIERLEKDTQVILGATASRANPDGSHDIFVPVAWHADPTPVLAALAPHFELADPKPAYIGLRARAQAQGTQPKQPYSEALLGWLSKRRLRIVVSIEEFENELTVAAAASCGARCPNEAPYRLQLERDFDDPQRIVSKLQNAQNPLVLAHVPASLLDKVGRVRSRVEWVDVP